jgi:release factor glutamine methyltransferase
VLLAWGLGLRRIDLYLRHDRPLGEDDLARLRAVIAERGRGVPVAYLVGEKEFFSLPFGVTRDVLVPRPETETLVEAGLAAVAGAEAPLVADVGTGSGCVLVAVLHRVPAATGFATDVSAAALAVAASNAERHGVSARARFLEGAWLAPLRATDAWGRLDVVLSNPPYVVRADPTLDPAVAAHEPAAALYVEGSDPLAAARAVASEARAALRPGGFLALEVGAGSAPAGVQALAALGYEDVAATRDAGGIERIVSGRSPRARI